MLDSKKISHTWHEQDKLSQSEIRQLVYNGKNVIVENNHDYHLGNYCKYKNCIFVDGSPFRTYGYIFDNDGWNEKSRICKNTEWRQPITKLGMRRLIELRKECGIKKPIFSDSGSDVYIASKSAIETERSVSIFKKNNITFDKVLVDSSFPSEATEIAKYFAERNGYEFICFRRGLLLPRSVRRVVSDNIEATVLSILNGVIPFCFAPSVISRSHACREYMGDINFYVENITLSTSYANSVIYRLFTEIVPADSSPQDLNLNPSFCEFLSVATGD